MYISPVKCIAERSARTRHFRVLNKLSNSISLLRTRRILVSIFKYSFQIKLQLANWDGIKSLLYPAAMIGCRVFDKNTPRQVGGVTGSCQHTSKLRRLTRNGLWMTNNHGIWSCQFAWLQTPQDVDHINCRRISNKLDVLVRLESEMWVYTADSRTYITAVCP